MKRSQKCNELVEFIGDICGFPIIQSLLRHQGADERKSRRLLTKFLFVHVSRFNEYEFCCKVDVNAHGTLLNRHQLLCIAKITVVYISGRTLCVYGKPMRSLMPGFVGGERWRTQGRVQTASRWPAAGPLSASGVSFRPAAGHFNSIGWSAYSAVLKGD